MNVPGTKSVYFNPRDPVTPEQARAKTAAMSLKAEVERARAGAPDEVFIDSSEGLKQYAPDMSSARKILSSGHTDSGEFRGFMRADENLGIQYRLGRDITAGLVGGLGGASLAAGSEFYSKSVYAEDGSGVVSAVTVDPSSGYMHYTEFNIPGSS